MIRLLLVSLVLAGVATGVLGGSVYAAPAAPVVAAAPAAPLLAAAPSAPLLAAAPAAVLAAPTAVSYTYRPQVHHPVAHVPYALPYALGYYG
uniref:Putative secreted protein n=1 Tax=Ixodes ricinus TaxID=34613 RepID=A0A6B0UCJ7_IXORI